MSFDSAIVAHFGGDTTDLRASTEEASIMMKGFSTGASRAVNEIGQGFVGAVVFMEAVKGIRDLASAAMDAAEQERQASEVTGQSISDQSQAWLDLKDGIGDAKSGVVGFFTSAIGIFPAIGDGIGGMINSLMGISPVAQEQYTQMANDATENLARIKAAHDAYLQELPAKTKQVNSEIAAADQQLADQEMNLQEKIDANLADQAAIKQQMSKTDPTSLAYLQETLKLKNDELALDKLQAEQDRQDQEADKQAQEMMVEAETKYVQQLNDQAKATADTQTIEEQLVSLKQLEAQYAASAADAADNQKLNEMFLAASAEKRVEIAEKENEIKKETALSEQDQLAIFIKESPALENLNTLSDDQLQLLKLQSQEKQTQYQIDQLVGLGVDNLNAKQRDQLTALIQQNAKIQQAVDLINQADAGETNLGDASKQTADEMERQADAAQKVTDALNASGGPKMDASQFAGYNPNYTGFYGVGFGDQQLQDQYTSQNNQQFLGGEATDLQKQLQADENADTSSASAAIPGLEKRIQDLHLQMIGQLPLGNPNSTQPGVTQDQQQTQKQTDLLQGIHDKLDTLVGG